MTNTYRLLTKHLIAYNFNSIILVFNFNKINLIKMIIVINFLIKVIASIIIVSTVWFYIAVALIMWNEKFIDIPNDAIKLIWNKHKN